MAVMSNNKLLEGKVLVTGGGGVLGTALIERLQHYGNDVTAICSREDCELENPESTLKLLLSTRPRYVFHLAGAVYGVGGNKAYPGDIFRRNTLINCNIVEACRVAEVDKIIAMGSVAMYGDGIAVPFREDDVLRTEPHSSERFYAFAKRGLLMQLESYRLQFGTDYALALSTNLYGPADRFDDLHGHVVPSLVRKFVESAKTGNTVTVWGDGSPLRDFLFSRDAAEGLLYMAAAGRGVYNLATGRSVPIRDLVECLARIFPDVRYDWDIEKPMGQLARSYDISRLNALGFSPQVDLFQGLLETTAWYDANRSNARH